MAIAVLSDLHLGTRSQADVLRHRPIRRILFDALEPADEIVLLGDVLELREQPLPAVLEVALPFFEELGEALPGRRVTILGGNHDHHVVAPWLEQLRLEGKPLGLEQRADASSSPIAVMLAARMPDNSVELGYPGVWLRPRTYAHHGHYLDAHMSVPRVEAVLAALSARAAGGLPKGHRTPDDYEAAFSPLYAFAYALAQGRMNSRRMLGMDMSRRVWKQIDEPRGWRGRALGSVAIPSAVWALNRAGLGPFEAKISGPRLRESGLRAIRETVAALGIDATEVVFGHTHRPGPLPFDTSWSAGLYNTGSWLYEPNLIKASPDQSPYWPGCVLFIDGDKPPELRRLLLDVPSVALGALDAYS